MSQIIVCLKKYAKDSRMVYYFRLELEVQIDARWTRIRLELQTRIESVKNYKHGGYPRPTDR